MIKARLLAAATVVLALGGCAEQPSSSPAGNPAPPAGSPTGRIRISAGGPGELELKLPNERTTQTFRSADSVFAVPAGRYQLWYYTAVRKDEKGQEWQARSGLSSRDDEVFALEAGATKEMTAGPPFTATIRAQARNGQIALDFLLLGAGRDTYRIYRTGRNVANPRFVITDSGGKEVLSGQFEYG
ncbi:MAG: hypothetical protein JXR37_26765 [Kiritimatiellae bacterium]|nr:hypothetical protein [Kiritimatiellia bacterium]